MRFCLILLSLMMILQLSAQVPLQYSRVKINLQAADLTDIASLGLETDHGHLVKERFLINDYSEREIELLDTYGIEYEILIEDVKAWYVARNAMAHDHDHDHDHEHHASQRDDDCGSSGGGIFYDYVTPENYTYGSMGGYLTYEQLMAVLDDMAAQYPNLITAKTPISNILTHEGRPIHWLRISDNPNQEEGEPEALYTALHHAREPNSMAQMVFFMWYLLENYETDPEVKYLVDNTALYFIPCVNPDGYVYNESIDPNGGGLWRKNRRAENGNVFGVDLNRNYDFNWGFDDIGSSTDPMNDTYRGPSPASEPETQAVRFLCNSHQFQIAMNYHTFGNLLIHPWGYSDQPTSEDATFKGFGKMMTEENNFLVGTGTETVGYTVNGDSDDWMYGETDSKPKIFSMTPEVGGNNVGFWPAQSDIDQLNKSCLRQNLVTAHLLLNFGEAEELNAEQFITDFNGTLNLRVKKYGLADGDLTFTAGAGSSNVNVISSPQVLSLSHLDEADLNVDFTVNPGTEDGDEILFMIQLDNGDFVTTDTIRKVFLDGEFAELFTDSGDALANWTVSGQWGITAEDFVSPPTSITDSPGDEYNNNSATAISLTTPVDLTFATTAILEFNARWEIETDYDYVQVLASSDNAAFTPLCGKYTNTGVGDQGAADGQPLYDGFQNDWVLEEMNLEDYLGGPLWLRFVLISDQFVNEDGFYFDDLVVKATLDLPVSVGSPEAITDLRIQPNPFSDQLQVDFSLPQAVETLDLYLVNALGQEILVQTVDARTAGAQQVLIPTRTLNAGVYWLQLQADGKTLASEKVVKVE